MDQNNRNQRGRRDREFAGIGILTFIFVFCPSFCPAENGTIQFKSGGVLTGQIEKLDDSQTCRIQLPGGGVLSVPSDTVRNGAPSSSSMAEYLLTIPFKSDTIESHLESANWCKEHNLPDMSEKHLNRILELDPENEKAHRILGHVKDNGVWMSPKERLEARGLVRHGGQAMSQQEKDLAEKAAEAKRIVFDLKKDIKKFYAGIKSGNPASVEALKAIQNPYALAILTDLLTNEKSPELRRLLTQVIGGIGTPAALMDLGTVALQDANLDVRMSALEQIRKKGAAIQGAIVFFKKGLLSPNNEIVNRSAVALGYLEATDSIPNLIFSLITIHQRTITTGSDKTGATFTNGRMSDFSFGGGTKTKVISEPYNNPEVLAALRKIVKLAYPSEQIDFQFNVPEWRHWYQLQQNIGQFLPRRSN